MPAIVFTDMRIRAALPLHPYLARHPCIFLRLIADANSYAETPPVHGDTVTGLWEINSELSADAVKHSVTLVVIAPLAVIASQKCQKFQLVSVEVSLAELIKQMEAKADGYQQFNIGDSHSSVQFTMTCLAKVSSSIGPDEVVAHEHHAVNRDGENTRLDFKPEKSDLASREDLETLSAIAIGMPDRDDNKARTLSQLGYAYHTLYQEGWERSDLEKTISMYEDAMKFTGLSHPQLAEHAHRFAIALIERFEQSGDPTDIDQAISYSQTAVECTTDPDVNTPDRLSNLAKAFQLRFKHLGDLADIDTAISNQRKAVEITPDSHPEKPERCIILVTVLHSRFKRLRSVADMDDAISSQRKAITLVLDYHPDKPGWFSSLGAALQSRFKRLGSLTDINDAISNHRKAVELTPDGHLDKPDRFNNLGVALRSRFERLGSLTDINDVISNYRQAVKISQIGHPNKPGLLRNLGNALRTRFQRLGTITDIDAAISSLQQAVGIARNGHSGKSECLSSLGNALRSRFEHLGTIADIDSAIVCLQKAAELTVDDYPDEPGRLNDLGTAIHSRFERLGSLADMNAAISSYRKAVEIMPDGHSDMSRWCSNLGNALNSRYERLGNVVDMEDAIFYQQKAVELTPNEHTDNPGLLNNLGVALQSRFERLGSLADLDAAISSHRMAVDSTPDGDPDKPSRFSNLGTSLHYRFERLGSLVDIHDAISDFQKAVKFTQDGHFNEPSLLRNLGSALRARFKRLGSPADLDDAISSLKKAFELTPYLDTGKPGLLNTLGMTLRSRFELLRSPIDIDAAIWALRKAVELTPEDHTSKPRRVSNLGVALRSRFEHLGGLPDLNEAISNFRKAVEITPDGHPDKPSQLHNLGSSLGARFERLSFPSDLKSGLSVLSIAAKSTSGSAMTRFRAAHLWGQLSEKHSRCSLEAFTYALDLLPRVAWLGLAVTDQHALLAEVGGVVRDAVAAAIRCDEYQIAVVWAEQGRSIVWQNLLGLRTPVDDLHMTHPELADELREVALKMDSLSSSGGELKRTPAPTGDDVHRHSQLVIKWEQIVEKIRRIPDFESFLRAKSFAQLCHAAREGPIVILNVQHSRCDALVLVPHDSDDRRVSAVNIPLERFSYEKGKNLYKKLASLLLSARVHSRPPRTTQLVSAHGDDVDTKFKTILGILWLDIAKPVVDALAYQARSTNFPRIWWCATGLFAFLPIHAAGLHDSDKLGDRLSDYVVSSYTPSLTTILGLSQSTVKEGFQLLTVAQPFARGATAIPETEDEVDRIQRRAKGLSCINLINQSATVARVLQEMEKSSWVHIACHGKQRTDESMKSGLLLYDGTLELSAIVKHSLPKADFAFLSACQTAMGDEKVPEESVHLAAGMFLAGYKGVIATMWSINDDDAPQVAEDVYSMILKGGVPDGRKAAYALHEAVKKLRDSGVECVSWVPFIHIGR